MSTVETQKFDDLENIKFDKIITSCLLYKRIITLSKNDISYENTYKDVARNLVENAVDRINGGFGVGEPESYFDRERQATQKKFANSYYDYFYPLFYGYNKRSSGGSAFQAYSGVLNPRNAARDDYRYFDRMA